jgi:hypothetical protein
VLVELGHPRVVIGDLGAGGTEQLDQLHSRRFAHVRDVGLVRDAQHEDTRVLERAAEPVVERLRNE